MKNLVLTIAAVATLAAVASAPAEARGVRMRAGVAAATAAAIAADAYFNGGYGYLRCARLTRRTGLLRLPRLAVLLMTT
jgi:hypothetical protein